MEKEGQWLNMDLQKMGADLISWKKSALSNSEGNTYDAAVFLANCITSSFKHCVMDVDPSDRYSSVCMRVLE